jgi:polar amino acid transport system permease protein
MSLLSANEIGYLQQLASGAVITIELAVSGYLLALAGGTLVGLLILSRNPLIQAVWRVYASVIMGVPSLLVIFLFYYGGSAGARRCHRHHAVCAPASRAGRGLHGEIAELVRGRPQRAARPVRGIAALAIRPHAAWWHVIMPQAVRLALAGLITIWMVLLKDTAGIARRFERPSGARKTAAGAKGTVHLLHHRIAVLRGLQCADAAPRRGWNGVSAAAPWLAAKPHMDQHAAHAPAC